jgi:2-phosphosulfolactate phosphatase
MKRILNVYVLPDLVTPDRVLGDTAVVIDVLRASTTIAYALAAGAREVIPCLEIADALAAAKPFATEERILGGERLGARIEGFDLGNSPEEYSPQRVAGKTVIFTTTNGTRAILRVQAARDILIASFVNASAVVQALLDRERIHILCAGTAGRMSEDDILLAGMLVERLQRQGGVPWQQNGQAMTSREFWLHNVTLPKGSDAQPSESELLIQRLRASRGARNLLRLGLDDDIVAAAQIDRFACVPRFDPATHRIRLA